MGGTGLAAGEDGRIGGLDADDLHTRLAGLEDAADTGEGAAGADAGNEDVDLTGGVVPDLFTGGALVDLGVGGVTELAREHRVLGVRHDLLGLRDRAFMPSEPGVRTISAP